MGDKLMFTQVRGYIREHANLRSMRDMARLNRQLGEARSWVEMEQIAGQFGNHGLRWAVENRVNLNRSEISERNDYLRSNEDDKYWF